MLISTDIYQISFPDICKSRAGVPGPDGPFDMVPQSTLVGSLLKALVQLGWLSTLNASKRVCKAILSFKETFWTYSLLENFVLETVRACCRTWQHASLHNANAL